MSADFLNQFWALVVFSVTSAFTPGPNNMMLLASGVNHGFRRTVPHMAGVSVGYPAMTVLVALGLGSLFRAEPRLHDVIEVIGVVYLLWLSWKVAAAPVRSGIEPDAEIAEIEKKKPFTFLQAAAFQWVNVKGWIMAISVVTIWVPDGPEAGEWIAVITGVFTLTCIGSTLTWAALGAVIARFFHEPWRLRAFNVTMGILLVASLWPAFRDIAGWFGF